MKIYTDKTNTIRNGLLILGIMLSLATMYYVYQHNLKPSYINKVKVKLYGTWTEVGASSYDTDVISFSDAGVMMNDRLIATSLSLDGKMLVFRTGAGEKVYRLSDTGDDLQLKRVARGRDIQVFIKKAS
ncbi:DUF2850 domain-containing protein [Vibrio crassostreae]|uniref:DUF2850 domain-containing protein n=1 Tax=Vibrio crassostreae TaxID=246167 RepID=UPI001B30C244|nr:DUF2850 domain-containing protein [Vibrio crassostreae]